MSFSQKIEGCLADSVGVQGLNQDALHGWLQKLGPKLSDLKVAYDEGTLPLLRIAEESEDIVLAEEAIANLSAGAQTIVFFGTGGSSLGGQTLAQLGGWYVPGGKRESTVKRPRVRFYDNLDARTLEGALNMLDLETTRFVVTSKSGGTAETLCQAIVALQKAEEEGLADRIPAMFLGVTEPERAGVNNLLRSLFEDRGIPLLDHHTGIGGRYSCLTNVGLLPALAFGLDAREIRAGASATINELLQADGPDAVPSAVGAALSVGLHRENQINVSVMMPYTDLLARFSSWYVQLWSESLGKGGKGTTPVAALGPVDQHSILQLLMDGPPNYLINVVKTNCAEAGPVLDNRLAFSVGLDYLAGRHLGDLVSAQQDATADALVEKGRPVRVFELGDLNERALGALLMHFMLETIFAAHLYEVNPFDQPAVELGKKFAVKALSS